MISINILKITNDRSTINVSVETSVGNTIDSAKLWTYSTFKDYTKAIDISSKLEGINNKEVFSINIGDIGETGTFDGIYFIEFTATNVVSIGNDCVDYDELISLGVVANLGYFQECLLEDILKINYNTDDVINSDEITNIINVKVLMDALCISIKFGYYQEAIDILNNLRKLCKSNTNCISCNDLNTPTFKTGLNFGILDDNIILI